MDASSSAAGATAQDHSILRPAPGDDANNGAADRHANTPEGSEAGSRLASIGASDDSENDEGVEGGLAAPRSRSRGPPIAVATAVAIPVSGGSGGSGTGLDAQRDSEMDAI